MKSGDYFDDRLAQGVGIRLKSHPFARKKVVDVSSMVCQLSCANGIRHLIRAKGFILDMDGTIVDTRNIHLQAWMLTGDRFGMTIDRTLEYRTIFGAPSPESARRLFPNQITEANVSTVCVTKNTIYAELLHKNIDGMVVNGFQHFIQSSVNEGIMIALATSSPFSEAKFVLERLGVINHFSKIVDAESVSKSKPDPEAYLTAAFFMGLDPSDCVAFEDSLLGIQSVNGANMKCAVIGTTLDLPGLLASGLKFDAFAPDFCHFFFGEYHA